LIHSMTGFASKVFTIGEHRFSIEIKSYNHKYLDVFIKLPRSLTYIENTLKKEVSNVVQRGKIELFISIVDVSVKDVISEAKFKEVHDFLTDLNKKIGIKKAPTLSDVMLLRELFIQNKESFPTGKEFEKLLLKNFKECLKSFVESRDVEGAFLAKDIAKKLKRIATLVKKVEKQLPKLKEKQKAKIKNRIEELLVKEIQRERLEQEVSYMLDKMDVSEELSRLNQHLVNFQKIMKQGGSCGKKLDFYTQEMLREINTLSVKSQDSIISELSVEIKGEIEKIREQVQNVE